MFLLQISHDSLSSAPRTQLEFLTAICEDLHVHMNHWNSIKQIVHTDEWLHPMLPAFATQMDAARRCFFQLRDSALWWIDKLIRVGLQVSQAQFFLFDWSIPTDLFVRQHVGKSSFC